MASNTTVFTPIPDGSAAVPTLFNSRLSQLQLNIQSVNTTAANIISGEESLATGVIGSLQIADRSVTGAKLATSTITTRSLGQGSVTSAKITNKSITSIKIADGAVQGSALSMGGSQITARQMIAINAGTPAVGDPLGSKGRFKAEGIFWELTSVTGPGSVGTTGLVLADTASGPFGAYRQQNADTEFSTTSLAELALFSGNTTYMIAHSAGLVISNSSAPAGKGTGRKGDIRWASGFIYVCSSTSSWERAALSRF